MTDLENAFGKDDEIEVDIDAIMQEIRSEILTQKQAFGRDVSGIKTKGRHLSATYYEQMYLAGMAYDQLLLKMNVTKTEVPIIGPLVDRFRTQIHRLVLFYVNQLAAKQMDVNRHFLMAINELGQEIESLATRHTTDPSESS